MIIQTQRKKLRKLTRNAAGNIQLLSGCRFEYHDGRQLYLRGISKGKKRLGSNVNYSKPWIAIFGFRSKYEQIDPADLHECRYAALLRSATTSEKLEIDRSADDGLPALEMLAISESGSSRIRLEPTGVKSAYTPLI